MPKMSTREIQAILQAEKSDALGALEASELSKQRSKAMEYYIGDESLDGDMPPSPDRSRAVSTDVADTIEGLMPSLMEIFASGDDVVEFEPVGVEDERAAQQETDYVNHVFWHKNHGFLTLYTFFKDALLQKNGVVKVWWEETEEEERESYTDLDDDAYAFLASDESVEIVEHEERIDEDAFAAMLEMQQQNLAMMGQMDPVMLAAMQQSPMAVPPEQMMPEQMAPEIDMNMVPKRHDVTVAKRKTVGTARVEAVPPEEFGVSRRARTIHLHEADYCYHQVNRLQSELIAEGYDRFQIEGLPTAGPADTEEDISRDTVEDTNDIAQASLNKATRLIRVTEHYIRLDYEGNGQPQLYKITTASDSNKVLMRTKKTDDKPEEPEDDDDDLWGEDRDEEDTERTGGEPDIEPVAFMPFAALTPVIMTHRFFGRSVADLVMDIQRIKTALMRNLLDNIYLANNQRTEISMEHAHERTLDDLLTNRPGGIIRVKRPGGLQVIKNESLGPHVYPMLEYMDAQREWRSGVTRQGQGIDAKSLADQSATAAAQMFTMAQARMRLIARIFAETGVRDLFRLLHATIRKHGSQEETVRLRNKWVPVDPRNWKTRNDMTINVGIASGSKDQQMAFLINLLQAQKEAIQAPHLGLVKPKNIYNTFERVIQLGDLRSIEPYFTDPEETDEEGNLVNVQEQQDPTQGEAEAKRAEAEAKAQADAQTAAQQHQQKLAQIEADKELKRYQIDREIELREYQIAKEIDLKERQLQAELRLKAGAMAVGASSGDNPTGTAGGPVPGVSYVQLGGDPG